MEDFINSFQEKTASQKLLLVVAITVVLLFFISVMFLISTPKQKPSIITPSGNPTSNNSNGSLPSNTSSDFVYSNEQGYQITYPSSWKRQVLNVTTGGQLISYTVPYNDASEAFPRVDIQVTPNGTNITNQQRIANLSLLKLASSTATFKGQSVLKLTGVLPFDFNVNGQTKKVNKTFIFMTINGKDYVIDYAYYVDENSDKNFEEINNILNTFTF